MSIRIISTLNNAKQYLLSAECNNSEAQALWQEHMIEPFWADIAEWAPFDQNFKQPPCVRDLVMLRKQLPIMSEISIDDLQSKFTEIAKELPIPSEDAEPMLVVLYPSCVGDNLHGVVGTVVFGNIIIQINPLVADYQKWIPFVFAHEYHHNAWGYNHFVLRGGRDVQGTFLEYMVTEGQADLFARACSTILPRNGIGLLTARRNPRSGNVLSLFFSVKNKKPIRDICSGMKARGCHGVWDILSGEPL